MTIGTRNLDHVWIVNTNEHDGLYVFEDEDRARQFASRYGDMSVTEEPVMDDAAAAQFLRDTWDEPAVVSARDTAALDTIAATLNGCEWDPATVDAVAEVVRNTGRTILDAGDDDMR